jgi:hypothetical protein
MGFGVEALDVVRVAGVPGRQQFDGDGARELAILHRPHLAVAAGPQPRNHLVAPKLAAPPDPHRCCSPRMRQPAWRWREPPGNPCRMPGSATRSKTPSVGDPAAVPRMTPVC